MARPQQRIIPTLRTPSEEPAGLRPSPSSLTRVTVNITASTEEALDRLVDGWGMNKTDVINRAVRLADRLRGLTGDECLTIKVGDGEVKVFLI